MFDITGVVRKRIEFTDTLSIQFVGSYRRFYLTFDHPFVLNFALIMPLFSDAKDDMKSFKCSVNLLYAFSK